MTLTPAIPSAASGAPRPARHVEQVMGMPISVALRGRHAADDRAHVARTAALAVLREADRVFSTYRADSVISRLDRGELALADCPPEVGEVLALGERARRDSDGAFDVRRGGRLDPSGVVKGWAAERRPPTSRSCRTPTPLAGSTSAAGRRSSSAPTDPPCSSPTPGDG
jgi:thiamine biosynthesis lipoprotein ApbE